MILSAVFIKTIWIISLTCYLRSKINRMIYIWSMFNNMDKYIKKINSNINTENILIEESLNPNHFLISFSQLLIRLRGQTMTVLVITGVLSALGFWWNKIHRLTIVWIVLPKPMLSANIHPLYSLSFIPLIHHTRNFTPSLWWARSFSSKNNSIYKLLTYSLPISFLLISIFYPSFTSFTLFVGSLNCPFLFFIILSFIVMFYSLKNILPV